MMRLRNLVLPLLMMAVVLHATPAFAQTRNAAFLDPSATSSGGTAAGGKGNALTNTLMADPAQTDAGETLVNVARRVTVFFYNGFRSPVNLNEMTMNADGNVRSKVLSDDCKALKSLPTQARCSVVLEVVPSSPGPWSVELLLNHSGQGRIARAEVVGSTLGKTDEKSEGLAVSKKISAPIDFGKVEAGNESAARTMLIENDSTEPLKISSVDLISHDDGLKLREAGCKKDDELKPGESCPITIIWEPRSGGNIATDLIVHHSGSLGFVVVPIRGASGGGEKDSGGGSKSAKNDDSLLPKNTGMQRSFQPSLPEQPPSMDQIAASLPQIDNNKLKKADNKKDKNGNKKDGKDNKGDKDGDDKTAEAPVAPVVSLIGTVNGRAILGDEDGQSYVVGLGENTVIGNTPVTLLQLDTTRAVVNVMGQRKEIYLRRAATVMHKDEKSSAFEIGGGGSGVGSVTASPTSSTGSGSSSSSSSGSEAPSLGLGGGVGYSPATTSTPSPNQPSAPLGSTMGIDTPTPTPPKT